MSLLKEVLSQKLEQLKIEKKTGGADIENTHPHTVLKKTGLSREEQKRDGYGIKPFCYSLTLKEYEKLSH